MRAVLAFLALLAVVPAAHAQDPEPGTPEWQAREAENFARTSQRPSDRAAQGIVDPATDPARALRVWAPERGEALDAGYLNRYGANIAVRMFRPPLERPRPLPSVVVIPGAGTGTRPSYHFLGEDLAEHGYLVLIFDPQGQGASDSQGRPETCEAEGPWREPQEMGIREQGACAGQMPQGDLVTGSEGDIFTHELLGTPVDHTATAETYRALAGTFVLGGLDATAWMLSDENPWRAWVNPRRVGITGHSAGAYGATQAANGDPLHRFRAAVGLDGYHPVDLGVAPRVPTLWIQSEQENAMRTMPPRDEQAARSLHPTWAAFDAFRAAGVNAGHVVLRGSTHLDFTDASLPASRDGARYASYLTLAWFDRFLRGRRSGTRRLFAQRFDDSIDVSSIGTGGVGVGGDGYANVPPTIAGEKVGDAFSYYYDSALAAFGADCDQLRLRPCALPRPRIEVRRAGRRLRLRTLRGDPAFARVRLRAGGRLRVRFDLRGRGRAKLPRKLRGNVCSVIYCGRSYVASRPDRRQRRP